jgi:hypothetical protein
MAEDIVTKGRFAAIAGVSQARVTQYLADGQIPVRPLSAAAIAPVFGLTWPWNS